MNLNLSFAHKTREEIYQEILRWGDQLPPFRKEWICEENRVEGCQSKMYLHAEMEGDHLRFFAHSDALISKGLAAILIAYYNGMTPERLFQSEPTFLEEWGIIHSLSPTRANGVASLWLKMKQATIALLLRTKASNAARPH